MNKYRLKTRTANLDVVHGAARCSDALEERRQFRGDVLHPRFQDAAFRLDSGSVVTAVYLRRGISVERRIELERDQPEPSNRLVDQLRHRSRRDHFSMVDDYRAR